MKANKAALPALGLLLIIGFSAAQALLPIDWTTPPTTRILNTNECYD